MGAWTTLTIKDGTGTSRTVPVYDIDGAGTSGYIFGQLITNVAGDGIGKVEVEGTVAEGASAASVKPNVIGGVYVASPGAVSTGQAVKWLMSAEGVGKVVLCDASGTPFNLNDLGPDVITAVDSYTTDDINLAAAGTFTISAPGANKQVWVHSLALKTNGTTATAQIQADAGGTPVDKSGVFTLTDNDGFVMPGNGNFNMPWIIGDTNKTLDIVTTGSGTVDGVITYSIVDIS